MEQYRLRLWAVLVTVQEKGAIRTTSHRQAVDDLQPTIWQLCFACVTAE